MSEQDIYDRFDKLSDEFNSIEDKFDRSEANKEYLLELSVNLNHLSGKLLGFYRNYRIGENKKALYEVNIHIKKDELMDGKGKDGKPITGVKAESMAKAEFSELKLEYVDLIAGADINMAYIKRIDATVGRINQIINTLNKSF